MELELERGLVVSNRATGEEVMLPVAEGHDGERLKQRQTVTTDGEPEEFQRRGVRVGLVHEVLVVVVSGVGEADPEEGKAALRADHARLVREGRVIGFGGGAVHAEVGHGRRVGGI
jgi:hypothetical protein